MKKYLMVVLTLLFLVHFSASAQKKKIQFCSIYTGALIAGEDKSSSAYQTVNGLRLSDWFAGIGIGIDNYHYQTLPLFIDVRKFFGKEKRAFIYGDLGYNFSMKNKPDKEIYYYATYHFSGNIYADVGIGFQFYLTKNSSLLFSFGNSYKKLQVKTEPANECTGAPCTVDYTAYKFSFNTMILKAGLVF